VLVDSTTAKAHQAAAGQKSTAAAEGLGRNRGGFSSKSVMGESCRHPARVA